MMRTSHPTAAGRSRDLAVAVVASALVLEVLDLTILNVAIPVIRVKLGATGADIEGVVAGYALTFGSLLLAGGRLGDVLGYRTLFLAGLLGFTLSSVGCGLAATPLMLILARSAQGVGAALMAPQILSVIQILYAPGERHRVLGLFGILGGASSILGPIVGGLILKADLFGLSWRPLFLINAPIGLTAAVLALRYLPTTRSETARQFDGVGSLLSASGALLLLAPLVIGARLTGFERLSLTGLGVCAVAGLWHHLSRRGRSGGAALFPLSLFRQRPFATGLTIVVLFQMVTGSLLVCASVALQTGLGCSPLQTALLHVPFAVGVALAIGLLGRRLAPRLGRALPMIGTAAMALGVGGFAAALHIDGAVLRLAGVEVAFAAAGLGMGLISAPLSALTLARVAVSDAGAASGLFNTGQQLGAAIGMATLGGLFLAVAAPGASVARISGAFGQLAACDLVLLAAVAALCRGFPPVAAATSPRLRRAG